MGLRDYGILGFWDFGGGPGSCQNDSEEGWQVQIGRIILVYAWKTQTTD